MSSQPARALTIALKFLKSAERTEAELRAHLESKVESLAEVERVVRLMAEKKFVSDVRLVEREVELAKGVRKLGKERTRMRLLQRGADEGVVREVDGQYSEAEETANAITLIQTRGKGDPQRAARILASRGFSEDAARAALEKTFPEIDW